MLRPPPSTPIGSEIQLLVPADVDQNTDPIWVVQKKASNYHFFADKTGVSLCYVDEDARIKMIKLRSGVTQSIDGQWKACKRLPNLTNDPTNSYLPFAPTPSGYYSCYCVNPTTPEKAYTLDLLMLIVPKLERRSSPQVLHLGGIDLIGLKFHYPTQGAPDRAVLMHQPMSPEFPDRGRSIVAYPMTSLTPKEKIYGCFSTTNYDFTSKVVHVRAIYQEILKALDAYCIVDSPFNFWANSNRSILYSSYAEDEGYIPLMLDMTRLIPDATKVGEHCKTWKWQYALGDVSAKSQKWYDIAETKVHLFVTVDHPQRPWGARVDTMPVAEGKNEDGRERISTTNTAPYVEMVIQACEWAKGASNQSEAAAWIANGLMASGILIYDAATTRYTSYQNYTDAEIPNSGIVIHGMTMMETLRGILGSPLRANCVDLSRTVLLLGTSIGCKLKIGRIWNAQSPFDGFSLNEHLPLGSEVSVKDGSFKFHEVAYLGDAFDKNCFIFDASMRFVDANGSPEQILGMPFEDYLRKLVKGDDLPKIGIKDLQDLPMRIV